MEIPELTKDHVFHRSDGDVQPDESLLAAPAPNDPLAPLVHFASGVDVEIFGLR